MLFSFGHVFVCFVCPIIVSCIINNNVKIIIIINNNIELQSHAHAITMFLKKATPQAEVQVPLTEAPSAFHSNPLEQE